MREFTFGTITLRLADSCVSGAYDLTDSSGVVPYSRVEVYGDSVQFYNIDPNLEFEVFFDTSEGHKEDVLLFALKFMLCDQSSRNMEKIRDLEVENGKIYEMLKSLYATP